MKLPQVFRRMTVEEARRRLAKSARAQALHHELEALRLRHEARVTSSEAHAHEERARAYRAMVGLYEGSTT